MSDARWDTTSEVRRVWVSELGSVEGVPRPRRSSGDAVTTVTRSRLAPCCVRDRRTDGAMGDGEEGGESGSARGAMMTRVGTPVRTTTSTWASWAAMASSSGVGCSNTTARSARASPHSAAADLMAGEAVRLPSADARRSGRMAGDWSGKATTTKLPIASGVAETNEDRAGGGRMAWWAVSPANGSWVAACRSTMGSAAAMALAVAARGAETTRCMLRATSRRRVWRRAMDRIHCATCIWLRWEMPRARGTMRGDVANTSAGELSSCHCRRRSRI
mmetsp:Transcript_38080/g.89019  ORF Transcript_38080/g.89019 Transcript_38080/m.89019 type:complete len:275 (-) Transcript_38080:554-1378(-)